ncbi:MAG: N-acetylmuramoyl-L-alanine amidase [Ktedonobacteraceae bacterium]|nr:N-acetylmuramoyl-L-alanine amidase [Ktedonobacteraceae bacterium]
MVDGRQDGSKISHDQERHGISRRRVIKTAFGVATVVAAGGLEFWRLTPSARAAGAIPDIIGCDAWGARPPSEPVAVLDTRATKILVHHTAYPNSTDYSLEQAYWLVRDIQNLHMDTNGWIDTGQHFTVSRGGYLLEGRHRSLETLQTGDRIVRAAHCPGLNSESIGIENEGTYIDTLPTEMLWNSLVNLCVYICQQYGFNANNIFGHWDFRDTDCPGIAFYKTFPELRRQVAQRLGLVNAIPARTWPDQRITTTGPVVRVLQRLLNLQGSQLVVDGNFGAQTDSAVRAFQAARGITADGYTRNDTWEKLVMPLKKDAQGEAVTAIQEILQHKGYAVTVNGDFDFDTMKAVKEMQELHGLPPNGLVDVDSWCAIVGGILKAEFKTL